LAVGRRINLEALRREFAAINVSDYWLVVYDKYLLP
jgi:hypothetical protein